MRAQTPSRARSCPASSPPTDPAGPVFSPGLPARHCRSGSRGAGPHQGSRSAGRGGVIRLRRRHADAACPIAATWPRPRAQTGSKRSRGTRAIPVLVAEAGGLAEEHELDRPGLAVAVLGDDQLGQVLVVVLLTRVVHLVA